MSTRRILSNQAWQRRLLVNWESVPVGAPVTVEKDDGSKVETVTASKAWMMSGHTAVILLKGISGCYALDRVTERATPSGAPGEPR